MTFLIRKSIYSPLASRALVEKKNQVICGLQMSGKSLRKKKFSKSYFGKLINKNGKIINSARR